MENTVKDDKPYTYQDYLTQPDGEHWQIMDGVAYCMAPPSTAHQRVARNLFRQIDNYLIGKSCEPFFAPFSVKLDEKNVVEPDISVICDQTKITDKGCVGAPDWVIEVISPGSFRIDHVKKRDLYQRFGVKEYWIVDPTNRGVTVYRLSEDYLPRIVDAEGVLKVSILDDLTIQFSEVSLTNESWFFFITVARSSLADLPESRTIVLLIA